MKSIAKKISAKGCWGCEACFLDDWNGKCAYQDKYKWLKIKQRRALDRLYKEERQ